MPYSSRMKRLAAPRLSVLSFFPLPSSLLHHRNRSVPCARRSRNRTKVQQIMRNSVIPLHLLYIIRRTSICLSSHPTNRFSSPQTAHFCSMQCHKMQKDCSILHQLTFSSRISPEFHIEQRKSGYVLRNRLIFNGGPARLEPGTSRL